MKNKQRAFNRSELDHMLAASFLFLDENDETTEKMKEMIAEEVLCRKSYLMKLKQFFSFKIKLIMMLISVTGILWAIFNFSGKETVKVNSLKEKIVKRPIALHSVVLSEPFFERKSKTQKPTYPRNPDQLQNSLHLNPLPVDTLDTQMIVSDSIPFVQDTGFQFPKLTEDEIKANHKQKKKMIQQLAKLSKSKFALVPMGSCEYKGSKISVYGFYMQKTEVSNLEYRTFLFDLLINNRKEEFLKAKPDQNKWNSAFDWNFNEPMSKNYFSHPAYNDYPVVNISAEAAEMYCRWLTVETNKSLQDDNKSLINDVRIPHEYEWALAACSKQNKTKYANGKDTLLIKGQYQANYGGISKAETFYSPERDIYFPQSTDFNNKNESALIKMTKDGALQTWVVVGYPPNEYGIYNLAGNVSEFVVRSRDSLDKKYSVKGGNWFSSDYFLKIDAEDEFNRPTESSPLKGLRVVISNNFKRRKVPF